MIVAIICRPPLRVWHTRLAEYLAAEGHKTHFAFSPSPRRLVLLECAMVLAFERFAYGARSTQFAPVSRTIAAGADIRPDVTIDLTGTSPLVSPSIAPDFDGCAGEEELVRILLQGRTPTINLVRYSDGEKTNLASGYPAVETPDVLWRSLDQVLVRLVDLIVQAVRNMTRHAVVPPRASVLNQGGASPIAFFVRGLSGVLGRRFGGRKGRPPPWSIAYRKLEDGGVRVAHGWSSASFAKVPNDAGRFFADPFPFRFQDRTFVFFEDYPYATKKGVIGFVEIADDGRCSSPRVALELPTHLSYPFVFEHDGTVYMLPEMSRASRIQLFRAESLPDRWVPDRILIDCVVAGDATIIEHDGRHWMFASLAGDGGSSWDKLGIFYADSVMGPWIAHAGNPVLIDAGASRPAGAMWHDNGVLMRVAQDCRTGYGIGLVICRVDRLDTQTFVQTVVARLGPPAGHGADGTHTLNVAGDLEVVDLRLTHAPEAR